MSGGPGHERQANPPRPDDPPIYDPDFNPVGETRLVERLGVLFRRGSIRERLLAPMGFDALILLTNLATGVIVARALGPAGRGELAATLLITQMAAWAFSMGSTESLSYHQARDPDSGARLLSSWLAMTLALSLIAIAVGELLLPILFGAQTAEAIQVARIYVAVIPLIAIQGLFNGMLLGDHDFPFYNLARFAIPTLSALAYGGLWVAGVFSVKLALAANAAAMIVALALSSQRTLRRHGFARPDRKLLRKTLWYGLRAHAGSTAGLVNNRLDLLIIPAFLSATSVGLYSVATNVSSIITVLTGTIAIMVLPVAARRQGSARPVILTLQATMGIALAIAIPLAVVAPLALRLVYGQDFEAAALPLRILLAGAVLQAGVMVLWSGLLAANRPLLASAAIGPAALLTVGGLIVFLPRGGITAAAIITSVVYLAEFAAMAFFCRRTLGVSWTNYLRPPPA